MKKYILAAILTVFLLTGCSEDTYPQVSFENVPTIPVAEVVEIPDFQITFGAKGKYSEEGVFFAVRDEESSKRTLYFADSSTDAIYPLCARPNCSHDTDECPAHMKVSNLYFIGEYLYFVEDCTEVSGAEEERIVRQRPDGSDRQNLFRQEAAQYESASIHSTFYDGDTVYFTTFGSVFDPESGEILSGEHIYVGDLKTGKARMIPMEFGEGNGTTLAILGKYGNELLIQRQFGGSGLTPERNYHEAFFFLDLDTCKITLIAEFTLDDKRSWDMVGQSLLYFKLNWSESQYIMTHEKEGELYRQTCDVLVIDLENRTGYRKNGVTLTKSMLSDEFYIYFEWNEDQTAFTKMIKDLRSGEVCAYPQNVPDMVYPVRIGKSIYFQVWSEDGKQYIARINEDDFWNGNPAYFVFPEWACNGIIF